MIMEAPANWLLATFDDVFTQVSTSGKKVKIADTLPEGEFPVVDQGREFISGYLNDVGLVVTDGGPLIIFGDHTREIKWVDFPFIPGADGVKVLKPNPEMDARFLYFFLRHLPIESKGYARHFKIVKDAAYLTPPLAEQTRIAAKIDELLAQVDNLKTRIDGIPALLKRFRQSVLAAAVSGRLTEGWRKELAIAEPLPARLGDHVIDMCGGASPSNSDYSGSGVLALNKGDIKAFGRLSVKDKPKYVPYDYAEFNCKKIVPRGSILVTLRDLSQKADFLGLISRYEGVDDALITQGMYRLMLDGSSLLADFLISLSNSPQYREQVKREKVGATQVHLRNEQFLNISFLLFGLDEQTEVVRRVEQLFAFADQLEARLKSAQARIDRLTQSILAKAFRGELVPQDPSDEPASELLARIQAQRAAAPKVKRGRIASA